MRNIFCEFINVFSAPVGTENDDRKENIEVLIPASSTPQCSHQDPVEDSLSTIVLQSQISILQQQAEANLSQVLKRQQVYLQSWKYYS